jgi:hypothetical protein
MNSSRAVIQLDDITAERDEYDIGPRGVPIRGPQFRPRPVAPEPSIPAMSLARHTKGDTGEQDVRGPTDRAAADRAAMASSRSWILPTRLARRGNSCSAPRWPISHLSSLSPGQLNANGSPGGSLRSDLQKGVTEKKRVVRWIDVASNVRLHWASQRHPRQGSSFRPNTFGLLGGTVAGGRLATCPTAAASRRNYERMSRWCNGSPVDTSGRAGTG